MYIYLTVGRKAANIEVPRSGQSGSGAGVSTSSPPAVGTAGRAMVWVRKVRKVRKVRRRQQKSGSFNEGTALKSEVKGRLDELDDRAYGPLIIHANIADAAVIRQGFILHIDDAAIRSKALLICIILVIIINISERTERIIGTAE